MTTLSCAVIGMGLFGRSLATTLAQLGVDVIAIDKDHALIETIKDHVNFALCTDITDQASLEQSNVLAADMAVVAIGENIESSILVTAMLKQNGMKRIIARAHSQIHAQVLAAVGAERSLDPEEELGVRLAHEIQAPDMLARILLSTGQEVVEVVAPGPLVGKTIAELQFRQRFRLNILAIKRPRPQTEAKASGPKEYDVNGMPTPVDTLADGDVLVLVGEPEMIRTFMEV